MEAHGKLLFDAEGAPDRLIGVCTDITVRKEAEDERKSLLVREKTAREAAEHADRAKDEFLATLSHELRTLLTPMLGWVRMLADGRLDEAQRKRGISVIERNIRMQSQLIEDLLDISRIITGKLRLNIVPVDLQTIIKSAVEVVRPSADLSGIKIDHQFPDSHCPIKGDPDRLQQVVWNLLTNAVKFSSRDGVITITLRILPCRRKTVSR